MSLSPDELKNLQQLSRKSLGSTLRNVTTNVGPINLKLQNILLPRHSVASGDRHMHPGNHTRPSFASNDIAKPPGGEDQFFKPLSVCSLGQLYQVLEPICVNFGVVI